MNFNLDNKSINHDFEYSDKILNEDNSAFPSQRVKKLDSHKNEVWSCDVKHLRVWSASSKDGSHIRPIASLFGNIYPDGNLLDYKINVPPEDYPDVDSVMMRLR